MIAIVFFFIALIGYPALRSFFNAPVRSVTTTGIGKKLVDADKAIITFTVSNTGDDSNQTIAANERNSGDILKKLSTHNVEQVNKSATQLIPLGSSSSNAYRVSTAIRATIVGKDNIQEVNKIIKEANYPIIQVRYLSGAEASTGEELRKIAIEDAKTKADQIAKASKSKLGKVLVVSEQISNDQTGTTVTSASSTDSSTFSQIEVQSVMNVTFELK